MKRKRDLRPLSEPAAPRSRRKLQWRAAVGAVVVATAAVIGAVYFWPFADSTEPPPLPMLSDAAPAVVELVRDAYAEAVRRPDDADAWGRLGMVYFSHQYEAEAIRCLQRAEQLDGREPRWPYLQGLVVNSSDEVAAEEAFRRTIALRPTAANAHVRLGEILLARHALADAEHHFQAALEGGSRNVRAHLGLARCRLLGGDVEGAMRETEEAVRTHAETREVQELRAQVLRRSGQADAATAAVESAAKYRDREVGWDDPWASEVLMLRRDARWALRRAAELSEAGQEAAAIELLRQTLQVDDRDPELYSTLAQYYARTQRIHEAQGLLETARSRHPQSADVYFQSGVAAFLAQDLDGAERYFRESLVRRPGAPLAHYNLGHVHLRQRRLDDALHEFTESARLRPNYTDAHINAAKIYLERREFAAARRHLEVVLQETPNHATARTLLERTRRED